MQTLGRKLVSLAGLAGFDVEAVRIQASRSTMMNDRTMTSGWIAAVTLCSIST